jgi:transposase
MMKVKQKISGCFRTTPGAQAFCRIRRYISTMKKQGHNAIAALKSVFLGTPLVPEVPG